MLHEFLTSNREELIGRCKVMAARRFEAPGMREAIDHGAPLFLQQVADILRNEQSASARQVARPLSAPAPTLIGRAAALHGTELLRLGFTIDQVVHEYGDVCQAVTGLAVEQKVQISTDEFRTLNRCIDNAIADAVVSFGRARQTVINQQAETLHQRLIAFSDEQNRLIDIARNAYAAIQSGHVGLTGATGNLLIHTLDELHFLADWTLPEIRLASATTTVDPSGS